MQQAGKAINVVIPLDGFSIYFLLISVILCYFSIGVINML